MLSRDGRVRYPDEIGGRHWRSVRLWLNTSVTFA